MNKKVEKGVATRQHIVDTARRLFASGGFDATSIEVVLQECDVSRGALYHHFTNKEALFEAVFEELEADVAQRIVAKSRNEKDPIGILRAGCDAWVDLAQDPEIRQIVFIDAPSVLGWEKWRAIEAQHGFGLLKAGLAAANSGSGIPSNLIETYAHILLAALIEVGMITARSPDAGGSSKLGKTAIQDLLTRLLAPGPKGIR